MGYYYSYRLGYLDEDNKAHPLAPFTADHCWMDIISRTRSYASDLHEIFSPISKDMLSDDMKTYIFSNYDERDESEQREALQYIKWCYLRDLPSSNYIKTGYFLIGDVKRHMDNPDDSYMDYLYDRLSPVEYAARLENYMKFGDDEKRDEDGDIIQHSVKDYMYYAYPDYSSAEYEASRIRDVAKSYYSSCFSSSVKESSIIVFDFEG